MRPSLLSSRTLIYYVLVIFVVLGSSFAIPEKNKTPKSLDDKLHRSTKKARRSDIGSNLHSIVAGQGLDELQISFVRAQLDGGLAVDALDQNGNTALVVAALNCRNMKSNAFVEREPKLAHFLLERGANPSATSSSTTVPPNTNVLTLAILSSCSKLFTELLQHPEVKLNVPVVAPAGFLNYPEVTYDSVLNFVLGSLWIAISSSQDSWMMNSLQSMAISLIRDRRVLINKCSGSYPPLFQAMSQSPSAIVLEMLQREDLDLVSRHEVEISSGNKITMSPLHLCLHLQRFDITAPILQSLAAKSQLDLVINSFTSRGDTPLLIIAKTCSSHPTQHQAAHSASLLLLEKADVNAVDTAGKSSLYWAVYNGCLPLLDLLLRQDDLDNNVFYVRPAISALANVYPSQVPDILQQAFHFVLQADGSSLSSRMLIVSSLLNHLAEDLNANEFIRRKQALQLAVDVGLPKSVVLEIMNGPSMSSDVGNSIAEGTVDSAALLVAVKRKRFDLIEDFTAFVSPDAPNEAGATPLCVITAQCVQAVEDGIDSDSTFEVLLAAGADINQFCPPDNVFPTEFSILQRVVLRRCIGMMGILLPITELPYDRVPVDVNAKSPNGFNALHLALTHTTRDTALLDEEYGYSFVRHLTIPDVGVNINDRLSNDMNLLPVQIWCSKIQSGIIAGSAYHASVLEMFLRHPALNDEQRELALNHCGLRINTIGLIEDISFWEFEADPSAQPGTDAFARVHLDSVLHMIDLSPQLDDSVLRMPMKVVGLPGEDAGGVVASFLDQLTAAAFCFGKYASVSSMSPCKDIFEYVQMSVDELVVGDGGVDKLFSPAPASLLSSFVEANDDEVHMRVLRRMKVIGALIGVTLNTLFYSKSLTLGVALDRVVLQRLIEPSSTIERSEALDSAVCVQARLMWRATYSLQQAQEEFPDSWPVIEFAYSAGTMAGTGDEWNDYCVELVDQLLNSTSPAFNSMLEGFSLTIPSLQTTHHFNPAMAHRMLVGTGHTTWQMLKPRLQFEPSTGREEEEKLFLSVLQKLSQENEMLLNCFVKEVTGASRLRGSSTSQRITIHWTDSIQSGAQYLASTCASTLHIRPTLEEEEMRSALSTLAALAEEDTFNSA